MEKHQDKMVDPKTLPRVFDDYSLISDMLIANWAVLMCVVDCELCCMRAA